MIAMSYWLDSIYSNFLLMDTTLMDSSTATLFRIDRAVGRIMKKLDDAKINPLL